MPKTIKGILVDTKKNTLEVIDFNYDSYKDFYPLLNCEHFDVVERRFGDKYCDVYCDDEGLFKEDNKPAIFTHYKGKCVEHVVGNVFICGHDEEGETISLTAAQIDAVLHFCGTYYDPFDKCHRRCLSATY